MEKAGDGPSIRGAPVRRHVESEENGRDWQASQPMEGVMAAKDRTRDEAEIRSRIERWQEALRAKSLDGVMANYVDGAVAFDLAPPLEHSATELRRGLAEWFPTWDGPIGYETRELSVTAGDDVAFSRSLNHLTGKRTNGDKADVWFRATLCFRKVDGEWLVAHEHTSVPFYMDGSFRAAVDLKP
jgi:ketosteroid isomerase-like protein